MILWRQWLLVSSVCKSYEQCLGYDSQAVEVIRSRG